MFCSYPNCAQYYGGCGEGCKTTLKRESKDSMDENRAIYEAIDRGGGQVCDVAGVIRELDKAGFVIVPKTRHS